MLSPETEQKARQDLRLAMGFIGTSVVHAESSEFDERNALSRAYYAMFHACSAWLAVRHDIVGRLKHRDLIDEMHRRGRRFGDFVRDIRGMRRAADYRADWKPQRLVTEDRLKKVRQEIERLRLEIEGLISQDQTK